MSNNGNTSLVAVVMGSKSDLGVMQPALDRLASLEISYEVDIMSAHRSPGRVSEYASNLHKRGVMAIIAGAGSAAHLAGVIAAHTIIPVIGVPVAATKLNGMDSLLSVVQMPAGIPVATVGIDNSDNAALLAAQIVAFKLPGLSDRLYAHKTAMEEKVNAASSEAAKSEQF